jgi:two-component system chemotaxis response regulator CheB
MTGRKTRVVIVDDSVLMRKILSSILNTDSEIEVVGAAPDPICARQMIKDLDPDVVTLDVEMPKMDGLTFLEKIMTLRPMPVIMVSSLTRRGTETTMRALERGAVDFVAKPADAGQGGLETLKSDLIRKVKAASGARVVKAKTAPPKRQSNGTTSRKDRASLIGIGASTGGVVAVQALLSSLSPTCPGVLITQHMPPAFTKSFATRLNQNCPLNVVEARDGDRILPGHAYIAPGSHHLEISRNQQGFVCSLNDGPLVSGHRPSVDILFQSIAKHVGPKAVGIILTGMGRDGAEGLLAMRKAGAATFGQAQASCVVYGMPRAANEIGAVGAELAIDDIVRELSTEGSIRDGALRRL